MNGMLSIVIILDLRNGNGQEWGMSVQVVRRLGGWLGVYGMRGVGSVYG